MALTDNDRIRLHRMLEAAEAAMAFCHGRARADLDTDTMLRMALQHALQIVGEAASRVSAEGRSAVPALDWVAMAGMRHRLVHAYFDIDRQIVWDTVHTGLPPLMLALRQALAAPGDASPGPAAR
jgi:uncharacterized protein with HEPN domain